MSTNPVAPCHPLYMWTSTCMPLGTVDTDDEWCAGLDHILTYSGRYLYRVRINEEDVVRRSTDTEEYVYCPSSVELVECLGLGFEDGVEYLLRQGARVPREGLLSSCAARGLTELCRRLLSTCQFTDIEDAFISAAEHGHLDLLALLKEHLVACDIGVLNSARMYAAEYGHLDVLEYLTDLVDEYSLDYDFVSPYWSEEEMLRIGAEYGHLDVVMYLVGRGVCTSSVDEYTGCTAITLACKNGHDDVVEYLVEEGMVDVNVEDDHACTALTYSIRTGNGWGVQFLIEHGARVLVSDVADAAQRAPVCLPNTMDMLHYLLVNRPVPVSKDDLMIGVLSYALGCRENTYTLLSHGVPPTCLEYMQDSHGFITQWEVDKDDTRDELEDVLGEYRLADLVENVMGYLYIE